MAEREPITAARLREILHYDPETGIWKNRAKGNVVGAVNGRGYVYISVRRMSFRAHRLAWLYVTGAWPKDQIDHINLNKTDNRWVNLREATRVQNIANQRIRSSNTSGYKGVGWDRERGKWRAYIRINGKLKMLGRFDGQGLAHNAYCVAAAQQHGEFARGR